MKLSTDTNKKLSIAVGLLAFAAFIIQGLGETWAFAVVAKQIVSTLLLVSAGINVYFLGSTTQKAIGEKEDESTAKKSK